MFRSKKEAADTLEISTDQLARYIKGQASPPLAVLIRLSAAKAVSLDWLASGKGQMRLADAAAEASPVVEANPQAAPAAPPVENDPDLYGRVLEAISAVYKEMNWGIGLRQLGAEAAQIAAAIAADGLAPEDKPPAVKAAAAMLRRQLRDAAINPTTSQAAKDQA